MFSPRACGLFIAAVICPPAAVIIATDRFGSDFWINFLLILAWLPGILHAWWVIATKDDEYRVALQHLNAETAPYRGTYESLPATMPPSSSKGYEYASAPPLPPPPV